MTSCPITSWQIDWVKMETVTDFIFLGSKITADSHCSHEIKRHLLLGRKVMTNLDSILKEEPSLCWQRYDFSSGHVWTWEVDHKESWAPNWCFWTVVLDKPLESPLDSKEIKLVNPKGNQLWIFIRRTNAEAEATILWPPDAKSQLIGKYLNAGKDWRQKEKGVTEDEMAGWHHRLNGLEFEQTPGDVEGQGSLVYCSPWGCKESDTTERLNNKAMWTLLRSLRCHVHCSRHQTQWRLGGSHSSDWLYCAPPEEELNLRKQTWRRVLPLKSSALDSAKHLIRCHLWPSWTRMWQRLVWSHPSLSYLNRVLK